MSQSQVEFMLIYPDVYYPQNDHERDENTA